MSDLSLNFVENKTNLKVLKNSKILKNLLVGFFILLSVIMQVVVSYIEWTENQASINLIISSDFSLKSYDFSIFSVAVYILAVFIVILVTSAVNKNKMNLVNLIIDTSFALIFGFVSFIGFSIYNVACIDYSLYDYLIILIAVSIITNVIIFDMVNGK